MQPLTTYLPTIIALLGVAAAWGASQGKLTNIEQVLAKMQAGTEKLTERVQEALTAKAVTAQQLDTLTADVKRLDGSLAAGLAADMKARHDLREELHAMLREMERRMEERIDRGHTHA